MLRLLRLAFALTAPAGFAFGGLLAMPAHAASCAVMTFEFDAGSGGVVLSPATVTVDAGSCVTFANNTITDAQFSVGPHYKQTAAAFSNASPDYIADAAGSRQPVTANDTAGTATGTIVVRAAPTPPPSPSHTAVAPAPKPAPSKVARPAPTTTSSHRPTPPARIPTAAPPPVVPLTSAAPGSSPFLAGTPTPTATRSPGAPAVVSGPLQPPSDRGTGLPAAVAALAVLGTGAALVRVLLAEPVDIGAVDDRGSVGAAL